LTLLSGISRVPSSPARDPGAKTRYRTFENGDGRFETRTAARAAGDVMGDLCGADCGISAVVEPGSLLDSDTRRGMGESDAHTPDPPTGLTQETDHGIVARPHPWPANDYDRLGHLRILKPNLNLGLRPK
jgi:hypothetical protein